MLTARTTQGRRRATKQAAGTPRRTEKKSRAGDGCKLDRGVGFAQKKGTVLCSSSRERETKRGYAVTRMESLNQVTINDG